MLYVLHLPQVIFVLVQMVTNLKKIFLYIKIIWFLQGFNGVNCQQQINLCNTTTPCVHGTCLNLPGSYICTV